MTDESSDNEIKVPAIELHYQKTIREPDGGVEENTKLPNSTTPVG